MSEPTALAARSETVLGNLRSTASKLAVIVDVLPLDTDAAEADARALLATLETLDRDADKARSAEKEPHLRAGQEVDARFRAPRAELQRITDRLRTRIKERAVARQLAVEAAQAEIMAAALAKNSEAVNAAMDRAALVAAPVAQNGVSESFSWEVDAIALGEVPVEFLMVDLTKVKAYVKDCNRTGRVPSIKGIRFKRSADLRVSSVR